MNEMEAFRSFNELEKSALLRILLNVPRTSAANEVGAQTIAGLSGARATASPDQNANFANSIDFQMTSGTSTSQPAQQQTHICFAATEVSFMTSSIRTPSEHQILIKHQTVYLIECPPFMKELIRFVKNSFGDRPLPQLMEFPDFRNVRVSVWMLLRKFQ